MDRPPHADKKINVTLVTTSFPRFQGDSAGSFVYQFARGLADQGCDVLAIAPHDANTDPNTSWAGLKIHFCKYFPVKWQSLAYGSGIIGQLGQNPLRILQFPFLLSALIAAAWRVRKQTDIFQTFWMISAWIALKIKGIRGGPVVARLSGSDIYFTRFCILSGIVRNTLNQADAIICQDQAFSNQLVSIGIQPDKIHVIPNGIDLASFKPSDKTQARTQLRLSPKKLLVLTIGGLSPHKGHEYLLEAIPEILRTIHDVEFIFIGAGDMRSKLSHLVWQLKLESHVRFMPMQKSDNIPLWLNAADIFVLPSLSEGTPNVLLEAMACGLPCVASKVGGVPELIQDGENGLLAAPKSSAELAEKILELIHNPSLREKLGRNAHDTISRNFRTWEIQSGALKRLYENILSKRGDG